MSGHSIEQFRAYEWVGNAYSDHDAMAAIHLFVIDENAPLADRAEALFIMGTKGMGLTIDEYDPDLPTDYKPGVNADLDAATVRRYIESTT